MIGHVPLAVLVDEMHAHLIEPNCGAIGQIQRRRTRQGTNSETGGLRSVQITGGRIEPRKAEHRVARELHRQVGVEADVVVNSLIIEIQSSAADVMTEGDTKLATFVEVVARIANTTLSAVETAECSAPGIAERNADPHVSSIQSIVAERQLENALRVRARFAGDVIDQATRG